MFSSLRLLESSMTISILAWVNYYFFQTQTPCFYQLAPVLLGQQAKGNIDLCYTKTSVRIYRGVIFRPTSIFHHYSFIYLQNILVYNFRMINRPTVQYRNYLELFVEDITAMSNKKIRILHEFEFAVASLIFFSSVVLLTVEM